MFLLELEFGSVFDGNDALDVRNVTGEDIQKSSFSRAGTAGDQKIQTTLDHDRKQLQHGFREAVILDHVAGSDRLASKTADREAGAIPVSYTHLQLHYSLFSSCRI